MTRAALALLLFALGVVSAGRGRERGAQGHGHADRGRRDRQYQSRTLDRKLASLFALKGSPSIAHWVWSNYFIRVGE
jgi:hypothetical protein